MKRTVVFFCFLSLVGVRTLCAGTVPVVDVQSGINQMMMLLRQAQQLVNEATQIANQVTQIKNQATQIANQVKDLQNLGKNYAGELVGVTQDLTQTLQQAEGISFRLDAATQQFDRVYPQVQEAMSAEALTATRYQWLEQRRAAAATGVQVQAVTQSLQQLSQYVKDMLNKAAVAQGNLDISQLLAQQNGLTQTILLQQMQMMGGNGRAMTQREAEEATLEEARLRAYEAAITPTARYEGGRGRLATYRW